LIGDVLEKLKEIPEESIDCVVTSPPYWGLRDYGIKGQWGAEKTFQEYLGKLDSMMIELKRIIKPTGSVWINIGDTYAGSGGAGGDYNKGGSKEGQPRYKQGNANVKTKSRCGIPERFYINCIDSGWIARNHIIWQKPNAMPTSVKDRLSPKYESILFFVKNRKYYFDLESIRIPMKTFIKTGSRILETVPKTNRKQDNVRRADGKLDMTKVGFNDRYRKKYGSLENESTNRQGMNKDRGNNLIEKRNLRPQKEFVDKLRVNYTADELVKFGLKKTTVEHWFRYDESGFSYPSVEEWKKVDSDLFPELLDVYYVTDHINPNERKHQTGTNYGNAEEKIQVDRDAGKHHDLGLGSTDMKKNPGDVWKQRRDMKYDDSKPYSILERKGVIYFRDLPDLKDVRTYLNNWRKERNITIDQIEEYFGNYTPHHWFDKDGSYPTREDWIKVKKFLNFDDKYDENMLTEYAKSAEKINHPDGKNPGDVWEINTKPFPEAHFATFPPELPRRVIKCACPVNVCKKCGIPVEKIYKSLSNNDYSKESDYKRQIDPKHGQAELSRNSFKKENAEYEFKGYKGCDCNAGTEGGIVLDPFMGSGTTAMVAEELGRRWLGIELNEEYINIIKKRLENKK